MNIEDKIKQVKPLADMLVRMNNFVFSSSSENGFFITLNGQKVLETETLQMASNGAVQLNQAIGSTVTNFKTILRNRMNTLLNA